MQPMGVDSIIPPKMNPGPDMTLNILNATNLPLSNAPKGGAGYYSQYQMSSWFDNKSVDDTMVQSGKNTAFHICFLQGGGDQDDGADIQINLGSNDVPSRNVLWVKARTDRQSVHRVDVVLQTPTTHDVGPIAFGIIMTGKWPGEKSTNPIVWAVGGREISIGSAMGQQVQLVVADLRWLFDSDAARDLAEAIRQNALNDTQRDKLANQISAAIKSKRG